MFEREGDGRVASGVVLDTGTLEGRRYGGWVHRAAPDVVHSRCQHRAIRLGGCRKSGLTGSGTTGLRDWPYFSRAMRRSMLGPVQGHAHRHYNMEAPTREP